MDLNKYFLLNRFPRKVVNSISNIPATGRRYNSYLKPTERIKPIGKLTQGSQQYNSEPEKSINLKYTSLSKKRPQNITMTFCLSISTKHLQGLKVMNAYVTRAQY